MYLQELPERAFVSWCLCMHDTRAFLVNTDQHLAHMEETPKRLVSREEFAKLAGLHPRRISALAREGKISGLEPVRKGSLERYFPAVLSDEMLIWACDQKDVVSRKRKIRRRAKRREEVMDWSDVVYATRAMSKIISRIKRGPRSIEELYWVHVRMVDLVAVYNDLTKHILNSNDREHIALLKSDWSRKLKSVPWRASPPNTSPPPQASRFAGSAQK